MTFSVAILILFRNNISIKWHFTLKSFYSDLNKIPIKSVLKRILLYTFIIELSIAILLFIGFSQNFGILKAAWYAVFHSVSAFCNAGFSLFSDSLMQYYNDPFVIITLSVAIILGGIGFIVLTEVSKSFKNKIPFRKKFSNFSLHTKIALISSTVLVISGTILFLSLEWNNILTNMPLKDKLLTSLFQSITCRTAGFNSIDLSKLQDSTLFSMSFLMIVGGSPGSIAGGIKTTTLFVIIYVIISKLKGNQQVILWGRALSREVIDKSTTLLIMAIFCITISTFLLLSFDTFFQHTSFLPTYFEMTSAFATVGLSTGITSSLTFTGKIITCMVMFIGRLGPLTLITALAYKNKNAYILYPEENIMIG
jgi:trk system potassium uptake protein TrkH